MAGAFLEKGYEQYANKTAIISAHACAGWMACAATIGIGLASTTQGNALIIHAIGAPVYFMLVSLVYFKRFNLTTPLQTSLIFLGFVMAVDFFVVALLINRSLDMFRSITGTWIPFGPIFLSTFLTGTISTKLEAKSMPTHRA